MLTETTMSHGYTDDLQHISVDIIESVANTFPSVLAS